MGLWATIRDALGLQRPITIGDPSAALHLSDAARARLGAMSEGMGIHVTTVEVPGGRAVRVEEGALQGPSAPGFDGWPVTAADDDLAQLRGRMLDVRDGRWLIAFPLELRARETPNPDGRLYLASQVLAEGRPAFFTPGPDVPPLADRILAIEGVSSVLFRDNTVTVERVESTPWDGIDRQLDRALREHFLLCGGPIQGGEGPAYADDALTESVRRVLQEQIAPAIHRDGGDIELVGISHGVVKVSMVGACRSCPASTVTLKQGVERTLKQAFPGQIEAVEQV